MARIIDKPYHREMITHRTAVHVVEQIADELLEYGSMSFYEGYIQGNYDQSVRNMVDKIKRLKSDSEKYHELRNLLKDVTN